MPKGSGLEATVVASQRNIIRVDKMHAGARFGRGGRPIPVFGPVDFVGEVVATGRSICFDAKETTEPRGYYLKGLPAHQLDYLLRHFESNAIAGLLVEAKALGRYFWIPPLRLVPTHVGGSCVRWDEPCLYDLGDTKHVIYFERIPQVAGELATAEVAKQMAADCPGEWRDVRDAMRSYQRAFLNEPTNHHGR